MVEIKVIKLVQDLAFSVGITEPLFRVKLRLQKGKNKPVISVYESRICEVELRL